MKVFHDYWFFRLIIFLSLAKLLQIASCQNPYHCYLGIENILLAVEENQENKLFGLLDSVKTTNSAFPYDVQKALVFYEKNADLSSGQIESKLGLINHPTLVYVNHIYNLALNLKDASPQNILDSLKTTPFKSNFPFEYYFIDAHISKNLSKDLIHFIQSHEADRLPTIDLYYLLQTILKVGGNAKIGAHLNLRLSLLHYGMFILNTDTRAKDFKRLQAEFQFRKALLLLQETNGWEAEIAQLFRSSKKIYQEIKAYGYVKIIDWHLTPQAQKKIT